MRLALRLALALLLLGPIEALAAPIDLSGTWVLDKAASDSLAPLLEAQGVSWAKRMAIESLDVTQTITQSGDQLSVAVVTSLRSDTRTALVDGQPREQTTESGRPSEVTHSWDGASWVTLTRTTDPDGQPVTLRQVTRLSADGATLTTRTELSLADGRTLAVDRVFRRG